MERNKLSVNVWCLEKLSLKEGKTLDEILELIAGLGVGRVDLLEDYLRAQPYRSLAALNRLAKRIDSLGLVTNSCWFYTDIVGAAHVSSADEVARMLEEYITICDLLGAKYLALPPGDAMKGVDVEKGHRTFMEVFEKVIPLAERYGVIMGLEVGRPEGPFQSPEYALRLVKAMQSDYLTITPDFESWRHETEDVPMVHVEAPGQQVRVPTSLNVLRECMPYSPFIHAKLLGFDEDGDDFHFPIREMMDIINEDGQEHMLSIEYEGWVPDINPEADPLEETKKCIAMLKKYLD